MTITYTTDLLNTHFYTHINDKGEATIAITTMGDTGRYNDLANIHLSKSQFFTLLKHLKTIEMIVEK